MICPHLQGAKLRAAHASNAELQSEVGNLKAEGDSLRTQMLRQDFDLTHSRAIKAIFDERVTDLEKVIAEHDDLVSVVSCFCLLGLGLRSDSCLVG